MNSKYCAWGIFALLCQATSTAGAVDLGGEWYTGVRLGASSTAHQSPYFINPRVQGIPSQKDTSQASFGSLLLGKKFNDSPWSMELEYQRQSASDLQMSSVGVCPASACGTPVVFNGSTMHRVTNQTLFVNGGYAIPLGVPAASITLMGGLGWSRNTATGNQLFTLPAMPERGLLEGERFRPYHQNSLAWNLGASVNYKLTPQMSMEFGYRYVNLGKYRNFSDGTLSPSFRNSEEVGGTLVAHQFFTGLRYHFN